MAYTKTPMQSTEQTQQVSLLYNWDVRDDSTNSGFNDTVLKNALFEPIGKDTFHMLKRDGFLKLGLSPQPNFPIIGIYLWNRTVGNPVMVVVTADGTTGNGFVQIYDATNFTQISSVALANTQKADYDIEFTEFLFQSGVSNLFFTCAGQLVRITDALVTSIQATAAVGAVFSPVFLDGYLFITEGTNIWNSNLNDPTTWSPSNFLAVDSYPDAVRALARVGPYIVALGADSVQWFYDAANPTGTPLAANVGATKRVGYYGGLAKFGDDVLFMGKSSTSVPTAYRITGLKLEPIKSFPLARIWSHWIGALAVGTLPQPLGSIINLNGHNCWFIRTASTPFPFPGVPPDPLFAATYVYDLDTEVWSKMGWRSTEVFNIKTATIPFKYKVSVEAVSTYISILGDSFVYYPQPLTYQDDTVNFEVRFRTPLMDFGTRRTKFGGRLLVTGDQTALSSFVNISWTDNDFKPTSFSTPRQVDMFYNYQPLYALGSFRARSFTMTYSDNAPMRWQSLELDYDQGNA